MNLVVLKGRLSQDVDFREGDTPVARYSIAVNRQGKSDEADFIRCVCFGKTAEFASNYLKKGQEILIQGRIQTGSYEKQDGTKAYTTDVVVSNHEFCGPKQD